MSSKASSDLYLSPGEQDLLVAALNSNQQGTNHRGSDPQKLDYTPTTQANPGSGQMGFDDDSPYLDFDPDGDFDDSAFDYDQHGRMIGDLPDDDTAEGSLHDKRKSVDDQDDDDEGGGKRREGEDKISKKPGRKPLTNEPTSKRKAQNRAAQRAFRERKERHLHDLEIKVDDLEKTSEAQNHENGLLRAQVERLQVELKEYRKRLSWVSSNGVSRSNSLNNGNQPRQSSLNTQNDFQFEFPKFGDMPQLPATSLFNNGQSKSQSNNVSRTPTLQSGGSMRAAMAPNTGSRSNSQSQPQRQSPLSQSPVANGLTASPQPHSQQRTQAGSVDSLTGLFSPSILESARHGSFGSYFQQNNGQNGNAYSNSSTSNNDSPSSSSESHNAVSSIGTSPEPSLNSPSNKIQDFGLNAIAETQVPDFGFGNNTTFDPNSFNFLAQQNNTGFDPVLFGDYRETQDNILSQDFGSFFNDAYPLPDLGSPSHNFGDVSADQQLSVPTAPKPDLMKQVEVAKEGNEEVVPNNDKPMTCNKIWDRLQSMEKFRNGEIDIDNLCSELRAKAKCSEGGAVVDKKDVDKILGHNKF